MLVALALFACTADSETDAIAEVPQPRPVATPSGACPDLADSGLHTMTSNGEEREFYVLRPETTDGAELPVVFYWHPLGGSAQMMVNYLDLQEAADDAGVVIVVPEALDANPFEWNFIAGPDEAADDLTLFDDVRACLVEQGGVDLRRMYTTGMSAGGLWSTFLSIHRGDAFASVMIMSGGTGDMVQYQRPPGEVRFPALLMWGGPNDTFDGGVIQVNFQDTTLAFSEQLRADGHFVMHCEHAEGHTIPSNGLEMTVDWLLPHVYGEASPWADRDPTELDDICSVPE